MPTPHLPSSLLPSLTLAGALLATAAPDARAWKPADGPLRTRWAADVRPEAPLPEYPRPQMTRERWLNLNGPWEHAVAPRDSARPEKFEGEILVPFAIESALSGVMRPVPDNHRLWYRRAFDVPPEWRDGRLLLHFGAVDWESAIWINGRQMGHHVGGYDPFTLDITDALTPSGKQEIVVAVEDPTDGGHQPRGKQVRKPKGIWYTAVTGIWQTVWLEPVPATSIDALRLTPDPERQTLELDATARGSKGATTDLVLHAVALDGTRPVAEASAPLGQTLRLAIASPKLWSPDSPFLYDLRLELRRDGRAIDAVSSYFGMRQIRVGKDADGILRLLLNGRPLFQYGFLDQGWWPDGLYTAPTDQALRSDVEFTRRIGMNMIRKHVKVEPARWYHHCDRLGILVWQDMPSGDFTRPGGAENYRHEWRAILDALRSHPSIVMWVPFNEGWGQHDTAEVVAWTKAHDPSRPVNEASGWTDCGSGDIRDLHRYPGPGIPASEPARALVLGEFGGLGLPLAGHTWQAEKNWGYRSFPDRESLARAYLNLIVALRPLIGQGLCAAVYTQTTDVEVEVNGLLTYDRAVTKIDPDTLAGAHRKLYLPPPLVRTLVPTSETSEQTWRHSVTRPSDGWEQPGFDDSSWASGPGGFGTRGTPGAVVRTEWKTPDLWLRRAFDLGPIPPGASLQLRIHHDEDATVSLNGKPIARFEGHTNAYQPAPLDPDATLALRPGKNILAIHCRQTKGGQYIDAGLDLVTER